MTLPLNNPDYKEFEEKIRKLQFMLNSNEVKKRMGKLLKDIIYRRVKSGKGVTSEIAENPEHQKLKELSKSYIKMRQTATGTHYTAKKAPKSKQKKITAIYRKERKGAPIKTGEFFSPGRSNATFTGQMLNSMRDIATLKGFKIYIPPTKRNGSKLTNAQVYKFFSKDRPFFAVTPGEMRILQNEFDKIVQEKIKVIFN